MAKNFSGHKSTFCSQTFLHRHVGVQEFARITDKDLIQSS